MGTSLEGSRKSYFSGLVMKINELPTPCFVIDETKLIHNLEILKEVEERKMSESNDRKRNEQTE